jgi:arsenate reductase (thioredoxin)
MLPGVKLLFLCTGNSCRSQMAEAWTRQLYGARFDVHSAGVAPASLDPDAVAVMAEVGIDLSTHRSKHVDDLKPIKFDFVITVCAGARERCPVFAGDAKRLHVGFDDPPALAAGAVDRGEALAHYRRVRDEIRSFVATLPDTLHLEAGAG